MVVLSCDVFLQGGFVSAVVNETFEPFDPTGMLLQWVHGAHMWVILLDPRVKGKTMSQQYDVFDPTGIFKSMRDTNMDAWSKMMLQLVNSEPYAEATGTMLDAWLTTSVPFRKALEASMAQVLAKLNMPTRGDVTSLAERLTNIEMRLDDLDAKLEESRRTTRRPPGPKTKPSAGEDPQ
jgi:hypothetical protein